MKYILFAITAVSMVGCSSTPSSPSKDAFLNTLDKRKIRNAIRVHQSEIQHCLDAAKDKPDGNGKLSLKWTVGSTGTTSGATVTESTVASPETETCAINAIKTWNFPTSPKGQPYVVGFPFVFAKDANAGAPSPGPASTGDAGVTNAADAATGAAPSATTEPVNAPSDSSPYPP